MNNPMQVLLIHYQHHTALIEALQIKEKACSQRRYAYPAFDRYSNFGYYHHHLDKYKILIFAEIDNDYSNKKRKNI